jgi:tetratricopeptide (TPR) repeat protein
MRRRRLPSGALFAAGLAALAAFSRCATAPQGPPRDSFPLDPRAGLTGPFENSVARGWKALLAGDASGAEREFRRAAASKNAPTSRAGAIGGIEALVLSRRSAEAIEPCTELLARGEPTAPLLSACGEARARTADPVGAVELYDRAASAAPNLPGLASRAEELRRAAAGALLDEAARDAEAGRREEARRQIARALGWSSRSAETLVRAGDVECEAGDRERALEYYREAMAIGGVDTAVEEKAGDIALELQDYGAAVAIFDSLASRSPRFAGRAAEARLAFRVANWPDAEREAARTRRLTRSGAALLVWWVFPEVREARIESAGIVATDVLERKDSRAMIRAVSLGLLEVDPDTHRARPDAPLTRVVAARMLLLLAARLAVPGPMPACFQGAPGPGKGGRESIRVAARCELLSESGGSVVGGAEFTQGLDRLRSLFPAGEAMKRD